MTDDYYALLGVEPDAPTDDIRAAYREKKAALDAKGDKQAVAHLNRAWNVLSDPYQRGRYDAQRERDARARSTNGDASDGERGEAGDAGPAAEPPRRRGLFAPPPAGQRPNAPAPTIPLPTDTAFPEQRRRITAMAIDLAVLLAVFVGSQFLLSAVLDANFEQELDEIEAIDDELEELDEERDRLEDENAPAAEIEAKEQEIEQREARRDDLADELVPVQQAVSGGFFAFGLLYLVGPSARSGQTLGKRLQQVRVIRQDGRQLGWSGAISRYGLLVFGTYVLSLLLGILAAALVLIVVMGWMRNPNQQGLHDRLTKTLVVDAGGS